MINFKNKNERTQDHGSRGWDDGHFKGEDKDGFYSDIRIHAEQRDEERFVSAEVRSGLDDYYASHMGHTADNLLLYAGDSEILLDAGKPADLLEAGETVDLLEAGSDSNSDPDEIDVDAQHDVLSGKFDNTKIGKFVITGMNYAMSDESLYGVESRQEIKKRKAREAALDADYDDDDGSDREPSMHITNRL